MQVSTQAKSQSRRGAHMAALLWFAAVGVALPTTVLFGTLPASALSEIKREDAPAAPSQDEAAPENTVPSPDPIQKTPLPDVQQQDDQAEPDEGPAAPNGSTHTSEDPNAPLPEILYDVQSLPEPVKRMRQLLLDVAMSGDIEKLRPLIGTGDEATQLSLSDLEDDPITYLKDLSGDKNGEELLAIMENILNGGYVHVDVGKPEELYAWPYFFAMPLEKLTTRQRVELFKIVTAGDYEDMKSYGVYNFYRLGITPEGKWAFFVAGE